MKEIEAKIIEIIPRTYNVKSFRLAWDDKSAGFQAGQFLKVTIKGRPELKRYLSVSSSPTEQCHLEFTKKITDSDFSKALNNLKPGDSVIIEYPFGKFTLDESYQKIAFLSGGIGITPIRSICKYATDKKIDTNIILLYANRSIRDVAFKEDFDFMQKENPNLKVVHVLCEPVSEFKCTSGLINAQVIKNEVPDYLLRKFYLCGPPGMVEAMKNILTAELSVADGSIVTENFQGY